MDIDFEKSIKEFIQYTQKYDLQNEHIKRKQEHSLRVMQISKQIAERLELSQEEVEVATLIGLLHDIARFEQYTQYETFKDIESIDHGNFGVEILEKDIRKYIENDKYNEIIFKAIKNHNKFKIEDELNSKQELFAKIIRDADKMDIFYQSVEMFWKGREQDVENSIISKDVVKQIKKLTLIKTKIGESPIDDIMKVIAFVFDINFKSCFQIIKEEDYINKILNKYNFKDEYTKKQVEEIRLIANDYVEKYAQGTK